jgi:hypothetical protein
VSEIQWIEEARQVCRVAWRGRESSAARLMDEARRATGLDDFGPEAPEAELQRLLDAYRAEDRLNLLGRMAVRWDNLRLLTNRLILRERETADPAIRRRPIQAPIFILGLPRSGTTFLHKLLAQDPDSLVLRSWQAVYPYPDHRAAGRRAGPDRVQSDFTLFQRIAPELKKVHPQDARAPQECGEITAHSFLSLRFDATYDVPSYRRWLKQAGQHRAFRMHRRFLQHLQGDNGGRWVLKAPDHVFAMDELRAAYPDARIVISHRDPLKVLPSLANLTEVLRRPFVRRVDRLELGREVAADWADGARRLCQADREGLWPKDQVFHVHFRGLTADPVGAVRRLYGHFGLQVRPRFEARLNEFVARHPNGGYGRNCYRLEDYGLSAAAQREAFRDYLCRFDVDQEVALH